jgi:hypothetical protein
MRSAVHFVARFVDEVDEVDADSARLSTARSSSRSQ